LLINVILFLFKYLTTIVFLLFLSYPLREKTINFVNFTIFFQFFHLCNSIKISEPIIKYLSHESCLFKKDIMVDDKVLEINDFDFNSNKKEIYNSFFKKVKEFKVMILRNGKKIIIKPNYSKLGLPVKIKITDNIRFNSWINRKLKLN